MTKLGLHRFLYNANRHFSMKARFLILSHLVYVSEENAIVFQAGCRFVSQISIVMDALLGCLCILGVV